jgi:predicted DNA-binding transcriptional regulator AlpA
MTQTAAAINPQRVFVSYPELPHYGVPSYTRVHLMRMMRSNQFPLQVQLSPNRVAWRVTDILAWVANRPLSQKARSVLTDPDPAAA